MDKKEVENILKNYHWMLNSIKIMRETDAGISSKTGQYGLEASMPKPQGIPGDPVYRDVIRRSRYWKKIKEYEEKVSAIQQRIHVIQDDRELEVLNWLLEGHSYSWIARHMGLSERHIRRIKDSIVEKMSKMPNLPKTS